MQMLQVPKPTYNCELYIRLVNRNIPNRSLRTFQVYLGRNLRMF
jgi:hypothetical protein